MLRNIRPNWNILRKNFRVPHVHFDCDSLGIFSSKSVENCDLLSSYNNLPLDPYVDDNYPPKRLRRYAQLKVDVRDPGNYVLHMVDKDIFHQDVLDYRGVPRTFERIEEKILQGRWITDFIGQISASAMLFENEKRNTCIYENPIESLTVDVHQVRQVTYPGEESHNSPEGIHRDGADYVVSAFVLNRLNVEGGESVVYDSDKNPVYKTTLKDGLGIFQEDRELWHYVSSVSSVGNRMGFRDIIGLDITIDAHRLERVSEETRFGCLRVVGFPSSSDSVRLHNLGEI